MKKILFFALLISIKTFGQSVIIQPSSSSDVLKIKKPGFGLDHRNTDGTIGVGTYAGGYIQTHTPHNLYFSTNNSSSFMTLSYSSTPALNGNLGIATATPQEKLHVNGNIRASSLAGTGFTNVNADVNGTLINISPVGFSAYLSTDFNIPTGSTQTLPINTEQYDLSNNFNTTTNLFTAPLNGIYHFDGTVTWSSLTATSGGFLLELYGTSPSFTISQHSKEISATNVFSTSTISADVKLNAGQTVKLTAFQDSPISLTIKGSYNDYTCVFSGHLIMRL